MPRLLLLISLFLLISCNPRDEIVDGGLGSFGSTILTVEKEGAKLPSCTTKEGDEKPKPTWNTIRFFHELNFIYPKINNNELSIIVSKGDFNCVKISSDSPVELETQKEPRGKDYDKTGSFVFVEKIEVMDTGYLLSNTALLSKVADGMGMSVGQMSSYLKASPIKDKVNITYVSKTKSKPSKNENPILTIVEEGAKLPSCTTKEGDEKPKPTWSTIRFFHELSSLYPKIKNNELKLVLSKGDFNCVKVSNEKPVEFELQKEPKGKEYEKTGVFVYVHKMELIDTDYLLSQKELFLRVAQGMGMTEEQLTSYLETSPVRDQVNVTYVSPTPIKPVDGGDDDSSSDDSVDTGSSIKTFLKLPGDAGKTASVCGSEWKSLRLQKWFTVEHTQALKKGIKDKTIKFFVGAGDKHCLPIGAQGQFEALGEDGQYALMDGVYTVESVMVRKKEDFKKDPVLANYVALDMGMTPMMFADYLENMNNDLVNMTFIKWNEDPVEPEGGL